MKTKTVEYFVDLMPGWQDFTNGNPYMATSLNPCRATDGCVRLRVLVELPCIGGSADVSETITATVDK